MSTHISSAMTYDQAVAFMNINPAVICILTYENGFLAISRDAMIGLSPERVGDKWYVVYTDSVTATQVNYLMTRFQSDEDGHQRYYPYQASKNVYVDTDHRALIAQRYCRDEAERGIAQKTGVGVTLDEPTAKLHIINPS
jgi:hypothetical protein